MTAAAAALVSPSARAQTAGELPAPAVELHQYHGSPFSQRYLRLDGTDVLPAWRLEARVEADYAAKPLVASFATPSINSPGMTSYALVRHAVGANLSFALGLGGRFEVAALLPVTAFQVGDPMTGVSPPSGSGIEALRLGGKVRILGNGAAGFGLGAAALASVPTGSAGGLVREEGPGGEGRLFADYRRGALSVGAGAGYRLRRSVQLYDVALGNELFAGAGAELRVAAATRVMADVAGSTAAASPFASAKQSPLEALVGVRQRLAGVWLYAAGGAGLVDGYGASLARGVVGLSWSDAPLERQQPILVAAGGRREQAAPPKDRDGDGIPDSVDECPNEPETKNGYRDEDGCPDKNLHAMDSDNDGVPDDEDKCPNEAEDRDGFEDQDGCPDPDNDKDGIADVRDKCPNEPETINNVEDDDGCPDKGIVRLKDGELETLEPIFFKKDRARVRHAFRPTLDAIAALLIAHPEIGRCAVQGHSDDSGPPDWNQVLSVKRAESVVAYLVAHGVDPKRLASMGNGDDVPWASNKTEEGRAANRRVIFHIEGVAADQDGRQLEIQKQRAARATGVTLDGMAPPSAAPPPPAAPTERVEERGPPMDRPGDPL